MRKISIQKVILKTHKSELSDREKHSSYVQCTLKEHAQI